MNITNSQIRARARSTLVGQYTTLILADLLGRLIILIAGQFFAVSGNSMAAFLLSSLISVIFSLFSGILEAGAAYMFLCAARLRPIKIGDLFYAFRNQPDKPILISLIMLLFNAALMIPFVMIGLLLLRGSIPAGVIYPSLLSLILNLPADALPAVLILILLWTVPAAVLNLTYSMALFLYVDAPYRPAVELMRGSREFMAGKRLVLFKLLASFAGYLLLGLLTFGIGYLWIMPYMNMSETIFYLENKTSAAS